MTGEEKVLTGDPCGTAPSVLIIDDEPMFLSSLRRMLRQQERPWRFQFVSSVPEARDLVDRGGIDVVVTDLKMPDIDGLQLLDSLKRNPGTKHMPVIMLTGQGSEESAIQAMRLGAADYLVKGSFTVESFERAVLNALEKLMLRQQAAEYLRQLEQKVDELEQTLARVMLLEGLLPICMFCKKIRIGENTWQELESYVEDHSEASFSHTLCIPCKKKHYGALSKQDD
jgi:DNA-binding NarL/FixJ family response regulator